MSDIPAPNPFSELSTVERGFLQKEIEDFVLFRSMDICESRNAGCYFHALSQDDRNALDECVSTFIYEALDDHLSP